MLERDAAPIRQGYAVARAAGMSHEGALLAVGLGWTESRLGLRGQFLLAGNVPSYNWGATRARSGVPSFGGGDLDSNGNPIAARWAGPWPNMEAGFRYWATFPQVRRAWLAFNAGDAHDVSRAFYEGGYYEGRPPPGVAGSDWSAEDRIRSYAAMLEGGRKVAREALEGSRGLLVVGAGAVALAAWWVLA